MVEINKEIVATLILVTILISIVSTYYTLERLYSLQPKEKGTEPNPNEGNVQITIANDPNYQEEQKNEGVVSLGIRKE